MDSEASKDVHGLWSLVMIDVEMLGSMIEVCGVSGHIRCGSSGECGCRSGVYSGIVLVPTGVS
jgi:hypothetical protein